MADAKTFPRSELLALAEKIERTGQAFRKIDSFDTWISTVDVDGFLEGDLEDFPSHIQDGIHKAVERQCKPQPGEYVKVVVARCYRDVPTEPAYLRIVVQAFPITVQ